jgi:hypothetical protein
MAGTNLYSVYRRTARAAAKQHVVKKTSNVDVEKARTDFAYFCDVVGDKPPAAHHKEWHSYLCTNTDSECLIGIGGPNIDILAPRGSAKSTVLGLYTAWAIGIHALHKKPLKILYISYTVDVARPKSAAIKRIIEESKIYKEIFPTVKIAKGINSNEYWSIDWKFAGINSTGEEEFTVCCAGLKGAVTSKRSHLCFTGGTPVLTDVGLVPIQVIYEDPGSYRVLTAEPRTGKTQWSSLSGVSRRPSSRLIRVATNDGNYVEATEDHPFVTSNRGVVQAGDLQKGDQLYSLPGKRVLLPSLVPDMQAMVCPTSVACPPHYKSQNQSLLLQRFLQVNNTLVNDGGEGQQQLQRIRTGRSTYSLERCDIGEGWFQVPSVQYRETSVDIKKRKIKIQEQLTCSPHRCRQQEQCSTQFDYAMPFLPRELSSTGRKSKASTTTITSVETICRGEEYVYDLETTSTNHSFFAGKNYTYVLNCVLDDIIKSGDDIKNKDIRQMMEDNWNSVIVPTMFEGGRAICLGTRFRHDDMHSTTFTPTNDWVQIVQSAITVDPNGDEVSYWPDMWSLEYLQDRRRQAPISFSFQYQNQIVQTSELSLSPDLIVKGNIATQFDSLGVGVDLSAGVRERNDYTVFVLGGRVGDKIHVIDCKRIRIMGNLEKLESLMEMLEEWGIVHKDKDQYFPTGSQVDIWSEAVAYQASLEADFKRICLGDHGLYNMNWHPIKGFRGDKVARFRGIMGLFEQRKITFNRFRKFQALTDEIVNFGVSSHDDCVDALVWLCNGLMTRGKLELEY